jgi:membrane protease subunit HflK
MAWNQPDGEQGGSPRRGSARPPAEPRWWRRLQQGWSAKPRDRGRYYAAAAGVAILVWLATGFYQIEDGETGVLQHFGAYAGLRPSGAGWHLPWPIETVTAVNLGRLNSADFQARMVTSDSMLVNVTASLQYQYSDARAALFAARDPDALVRELGEATTRDLVGARSIEVLMGGAQRVALTTALRAAVQKTLDIMGLGVRVLAVNLTDVQVPQAVLAAQRDLVQAGVERERIAREAQGYAAELVPAAQGQARRQRLDAEAYKLQVVGVAEGDAARFDPIAAAYARAPEVTRTRLYIETMETILARSRKIIIDGKGSGNTLVLPLDKLGDSGALKGAGVSGVVRGAGAANGGAAVPPPAASSASPTSPNSSASPAPPAGPGSPASAEGAGSRDDRGRQREERQ